MINKAGELVEHIIAAVEGNGATQHTDIFVRIGTMGATYRVAQMKASVDDRGMCLILETSPIPEFHT